MNARCCWPPAIGLCAQSDAFDRLAHCLTVAAAERPEEPRACDSPGADELTDRERCVDGRLRSLRQITLPL